MDSASQDHPSVPPPALSCSILPVAALRSARVALDIEFRSRLQEVLRRGIDQSSRWACSCTAPCRFRILVIAFPRLCLSYPPVHAWC